MKPIIHLSRYIFLFLLSVSLGCAAEKSEEIKIPSSTRIPTTEKSPSQIPDSGGLSLPATTTTPLEMIATPSESNHTPTSSSTARSTHCSFQISHHNGNFYLSRPISPPGRDYIDPTYRFGATQMGLREPHTGVEFLNSTGTPVLAVADGSVIFAGSDLEDPQSAWANYYGNLVILEHALPNLEVPIYSLYAHLSEIHVAVGELVEVRQVIGLVGASGSAEGSHLHFEVRIGENHYTNVQNPDLWLQPHNADEGIVNGAVAAQFVDQNGVPLNIVEVVLERVSAEGDPTIKYILELYDWEQFGISHPTPEEHVALGDLIPGRYRLSFVYAGLKEYYFEVFSGEVTNLIVCENTEQ